MKRWSHFLKKICVDASASVFPVVSPTKKGQLLYSIEIERVPVVALLDHGASHCFMSSDWAQQNRIPMKPLTSPYTFSFFNGSHDTITHLAHPRAVRIGPHSRPWTFFVVRSTPMPVVLGLDAIRGWPLFYSPLDDRLFIVDDTFLHRETPPLVTLSLPDQGKRETEERSPCSQNSTPPLPALPPSVSPPLTAATTTPATTTSTLPPRSLLYWEPLNVLPNPNASDDLVQLVPSSEPSNPVLSLSLGGEPVTGDAELVAENVIDFAHVACSPWRVEWVGESEDMGEVRLLTVTASGDEEQQALQMFLASLDPRLKAVVDKYDKLFKTPRSHSSRTRSQTSHPSPK